MAFSSEQIELVTEMQTFQVLDYQMELKPNAHGLVSVRVKLTEKMDIDRLIQSLWNTKVKLIIRLEQGDLPEILLFRGIVKDVDYHAVEGYEKLDLTLISSTWLLDREEKSRSFQNIHMTYREVVEHVLRDTKSVAAIFTCGDVAIEKPLIQYQETDFAFIKRVASHLHTSIIPDVTDCFWFGFPAERERISCSENTYRIGWNQVCYEQRDEEQECKRSDCLYYELESEQWYPFGTGMLVFGQPLAVVSIHAKLVGGLVVFCYRFGGSGLLHTKTRYENNRIGALLPGTVMMTREEYLKVHLDIDPIQDIETAYEYVWVPEAGNMLYCMPNIGMRVCLYLGSADEREAKVTLCLPDQEGSVQAFSVPSKRHFTSEHGKKMNLFEHEMRLQSIGINSPLQIQMNDSSGIDVSSHKSVELVAKGSIELVAEQIQIQVPKQVSLVRGSQRGTSVLNICNRFDVVGKSICVEQNENNIPVEQSPETEAGTQVSGGVIQQVLALIPTGFGAGDIHSKAISAIAQSTERIKK